MGTPSASAGAQCGAFLAWALLCLTRGALHYSGVRGDFYSRCLPMALPRTSSGGTGRSLTRLRGGFII